MYLTPRIMGFWEKELPLKIMRVHDFILGRRVGSRLVRSI